MVSEQVGPHVRQVKVLRASKIEWARTDVVSETYAPGFVMLPVSVVISSLMKL